MNTAYASFLDIDRNYGSMIDNASKKYEVDSNLIKAVIHAESGGNAKAVSKKNAIGLMQIMPDTFYELAGNKNADPFNPDTNIEMGVKYLSQLNKRYNGNEELVLAAYNAGMGNVKDVIPDFPETKQYVSKVMSMKSSAEDEQKKKLEEREFYTNTPNTFTITNSLESHNRAVAQFNKRIEQEEQIYGASASDKLKAIWGTFSLSAPISQIVEEYVASSTFKEDVNWKLKPEVAQSAFIQKEIALTDASLDFILNSKSEHDYNFRLQLLEQNDNFSRFARQTIGEKTLTASTIGGAVLGDPATLLGVYAIPKALVNMSLATRATRAYGVALGAHYAIASIKDEYVAGYDTSDKILDVMLGTLLDGSFAKGMYKPKEALLGKTPEEAASKVVTIRANTSAALASSPITKSVAMGQNYRWYSYNAPKQLGEDILDVEIVSAAKRIGYTGGDTLLLEDKKIRATMLKQEEQRKLALADAHTEKLSQAKQSLDTEKALKEKGVQEDIAAFQAQKNKDAQDIYDKQLAQSGLSKEEFDARLSTLKNDVDDITKTIKEVENFPPSKARDRLLAGLQQNIDEIRKVSQANADSLQFKFNKAFKGERQGGRVLSQQGKLFFDKSKKGFDKIVKQISKRIEGKAKKLNELNKEMTKLNKKQLKDSSLTHLERQKEIFERMKSAIDELRFEFEKSFDDLMIGRFLNDSERVKFLDELSREINKEFGSNISLAFKDGKVVSNGEIKFNLKESGAINPNNKMALMLGTALAFSATASFASDGDDNGVAVIPFVIGLALLAGVSSSAVRAILDIRDMTEAVKSFKKSIGDVEKEAITQSEPLYKKILNIVTNVDNMRTGYLESFATVFKRGSAAQKELANKLVRNWVDGSSSLAADSDHLSRVRAADYRIGQAETVAYAKWLKEVGKVETIGEKFVSFGGDTASKNAFNEAVMDFIEFGKDAPDSIKEFAKVLQKEIEIAADYATTSGVKGFEEEVRAGWKNNYMARYTNKGNFQKIISTPEGRTALKKALADSIVGAIGSKAKYDKILEVADDYITIMAQAHLTSKAMNVPDVEAMFKKMQEIGIDTKGVKVEDFIKEVHRDSDMFARGKARIPMRLDKFGSFVAKIDGVDTMITASSVFDRNARNVTKRYVNQTYGYASAVRLTGVDSYGRMLDIASDGDLEVANTMKTWINSIFGYPSFDTSTEAAKNVVAVKSATTSLLALSVLSTGYELFKAIGATFGNTGSKAARAQFMQGFGNIIKGMYSNPNFKNTWIHEMMASEVNGLGGAIVRGDMSFKSTDDLMNIHDVGSNAIRDVARKAGWFGLAVSKLIQFDDWYKGIANAYAATNLARIVNGKMVLSEQQMRMFGIDSKAINILKKYLKLDSDDELIKFEWNELPMDAQDAFRAITERIVMDRSTWTTLGATPTGSINNAAGVLLSSLTHFTTQIYTTQFIAKMKYGGVANFLDQGLWILSGFATYHAKALATGKEPKEDDALIYSIMTHPLMSPISVAKSYADPAALGLIQTLTQYGAATAEFAYEEATQ